MSFAWSLVRVILVAIIVVAVAELSTRYHTTPKTIAPSANTPCA